MDVAHFLTFASDAERLALCGLACWIVAGITLLADRRRSKRSSFEKTGWMPWTGLFLSFAVLGAGLLFMAAPGLLSGNV